MHEVIASLPHAWNDLIGRNDELKKTLRHNFLDGAYFDEYQHLLADLKNIFNEKISF